LTLFLFTFPPSLTSTNPRSTSTSTPAA
jgi:hypothetical protein